MSVSVIGGAHSPFCGSAQVVLDLQCFDSVGVDVQASTVCIGGGAQLKQVVEVAASHGLMVPLGTAPTVGIGLVLQGGIGHLSRLHGLAVDSICGVKIVVADGRCLDVSSSQHPDLFWAVCGYGPNFGVVLSVTLNAQALQTFTKVSSTYSISDSPGQMFCAYADRAAALPKNVSSDGFLYFLQDTLHLAVHDYILGDGTHPDTKLPATPLTRNSMELLSPLDLFGQEAQANVQPDGLMSAPGTDGYGFHVRCIFRKAPFQEDFASQLLALMDAAPCKHCLVHLQHCGGAAAERKLAKNAFPFQGLEWSVVVIACWPVPEDSEGLGERCASWVDNGILALAPASLGTYSVDVGPGDARFAAFATGLHLPELLKFKAIWDAGGVFGAGAFPLSSLKP